MIPISIADNINEIKKYIGDRQVKIVAVTKYVEDDKIDELLNTDIDAIGENHVKSLFARMDKYAGNFSYNMIGNLQTNKIKYLVGKDLLIQSLDRISLLRAFEKEGKKHNWIFHCLIQLNISREDSKLAIFEEDLDEFIALVEEANYVKVHGLMTIGPNVDDEKEIRNTFAKCKKIFEKHKKISYNNIKMEYLSMGMTADYKLAIDEGSNMIRIGSAIFK